MKRDTCCFTGHRELWDNEAFVWKETQNAVAALYEEGIRTFLSGGAKGFDLLAARVVLAFKQSRPDARLHMILPCQNQAKSWGAADRREHEAVLRQADKITILAPHYYNGCMQVRNRRLVDDAQVVVAYLKKKAGGTYYTVKYANGKGLPVWYI